jgi:hypothetical protein
MCAQRPARTSLGSPPRAFPDGPARCTISRGQETPFGQACDLSRGEGWRSMPNRLNPRHLASEQEDYT